MTEPSISLVVHAELVARLFAEGRVRPGHVRKMLQQTERMEAHLRKCGRCFDVVMKAAHQEVPLIPDTRAVCREYRELVEEMGMMGYEVVRPDGSLGPEVVR